MRVAINGFGRIGRAFFKRAIEKKIDIVAINDLTPIENLSRLLKYDSVYGPYHKELSYGKDYLKVENKKIHIFAEKDPEKLPWKKLGIDVVIECTGAFRDRQSASKHLLAGANRVVISAPGKDSDITIVLGVNEKELKKEHKIISMASCTTNCIAPIIKIINDHFEIQKGYLTTIHAYTTSQNLLDAPHKNARRGRAAGINLVPTSSGAATAVAQVIPSLKGKLDGIAIRAPVACGSICDFVAILKKQTNIDEINKVIKHASSRISDILEYTSDEIVSSDVIGNSHSSIFDSKLTLTNGNMIKVFSWYDNEYGYSCRLVDLLKFLK